MRICYFVALSFCLSCICYRVVAQLQLPAGMKQDAYCEYCKIAVQAIMDFNADSKNDWVLSSPCKKTFLKKYETNSVILKKLQTTCYHLTDLYGDEIEAESPKLEKIKLLAWLCHEKSYACIGLVQDKTELFKKNISDDQFAEELMKMHKGSVKSPRSGGRRKEEL